MGNIYFYCHQGSVVTASFKALADFCYQTKWYEYDVRVRKNLIMLIANYQRPVMFNGLKLAYLSLETYMRVRDFWAKFDGLAA